MLDLITLSRSEHRMLQLLFVGVLLLRVFSTARGLPSDKAGVQGPLHRVQPQVLPTVAAPSISER
jgi:hypothetical protein